MGAFYRRDMTSFSKSSKSRAALNHKHRNIIFLRIPKSLGKLFLPIFSKERTLLCLKISISSFCHGLFFFFFFSTVSEEASNWIDLLSSCLLGLIKRADCKQIFTASVWTYNLTWQADIFYPSAVMGGKGTMGRREFYSHPPETDFSCMIEGHF